MADTNIDAGTATAAGTGFSAPRRVTPRGPRAARGRAFHATAVVDPVAAPTTGASTGTGYNASFGVTIVLLPTAAVATGAGQNPHAHLARVGEDFAHARGRGVALRARVVTS